MNTRALYTIRSASGPYRSDHPDGGTVACLYHDEAFARDHIDHMDDPSRWTIEPVRDRKPWLASLSNAGFTHVYEKLAEGVNNDSIDRTYEINSELTSKRAWQVGRDIHNAQ